MRTHVVARRSTLRSFEEGVVVRDTRAGCGEIGVRAIRWVEKEMPCTGG